MSARTSLITLVLILPFVCQAVDREIVQLQRDVVLLNEDLRALQRSMDERIGALGALLQQTLDRVNEVHTMQSAFGERLRQQEKTMNVPVATLGVKLDQVVSGSLAVNENINDLSARLKRLEQKLVDVENAVRIMQAPPPPPPVSEMLSGPAAAGATAEGLYQSAVQDQLAGNYDLARQEFQDYLRHFGNTELAGAAQFHIGEVRDRVVGGGEGRGSRKPEAGCS